MPRRFRNPFWFRAGRSQSACTQRRFTHFVPSVIFLRPEFVYAFLAGKKGKGGPLLHIRQRGSSLPLTLFFAVLVKAFTNMCLGSRKKKKKKCGAVSDC